MIEKYIRIKISICILFIAGSAYALVGGDITKNNKIARLSKCRNIHSYLQGTTHGCSDRALATGSFISDREILTAGHFVAHFVFSPEKDLLKVIVNENEVLLSYKRDFSIRIPTAYYDYEKSNRNNSLSSETASKTCSYDIAIIELTKEGQRKLQVDDYYDVQKKGTISYGQYIDMYGYGNHIFKIYSEKTATLKSTLSWILTLGESSRKTWIKEKKVDKNLRVGKNTIRPLCETLSSINTKCTVKEKLDSIKSSMDSYSYYNSYMSSGDSGGPALIDNKIVGVFCGINSFHSNKKVNFVNLITTTYSSILSGFWRNDSKSLKVFR